MRELLFINPILQEEFSSTVRRGTKWADSFGDIVEIKRTGGAGEVLNRAKVVGVVVTELQNVPGFVLTVEHDPDCRNFAGLVRALERAYGEINLDEQVTSLLLQRI